MKSLTHDKIIAQDFTLTVSPTTIEEEEETETNIFDVIFEDLLVDDETD